MHVLGIAGTAKNTGKTTTTMALLEGAAQMGHTAALTSIGYDGETLDNVTGLPKPRVIMNPGNIVVTAEKCLDWGTARLTVEECLAGVSTPLGKLCLCRVFSRGTVVIAGPNKGTHLCRVVEKVRRFGADILIVDGALNRLGPMVKTDGIVLATGATRNPGIDQLLAETRALTRIFNLSTVAAFGPKQFDFKRITVVNRDAADDYLPINSLVTQELARSLAEKFAPHTAAVVIPGIVDCESLQTFARLCGEKLRQVTIIIHDVIKLLIGGSPGDVEKVLEEINRAGGRVEVISPLPLLMVTVNPFYPACSFKDNTYSSAYVDKKELYTRFQEALSVPVVDVMQGVSRKIYLLLLKQLERSRAC